MKYKLLVIFLLCFSGSVMADEEKDIKQILQKIDMTKFKLSVGDSVEEQTKSTTIPNVYYLKKPSLKYPENMQEFGNRGNVKLSIHVDANGYVSRVITLESVHPDLEQAAVQAMLKAEFKAWNEPFYAIQEMSFGIFSFLDGVDPFKMPKASKKLPEDLQYDEPPEIKVAAPLVYPLDLLKNKTRGKAKVYVLIDPLGQVRESKVLSATSPEFGLAAKASFQSWQFYPAKKDKQNSWSVITKEFDFNAVNRDTRLSDSANEIIMGIRKNKDPSISMQKLDNIPKRLYAPLPANVSKGMANRVGIEFYLDKDGLVQLPTLLSYENEEQAWLALTAVKRWQFSVPTLNGQPVVAKLVLPLEFK